MEQECNKRAAGHRRGYLGPTQLRRRGLEGSAALLSPWNVRSTDFRSAGAPAEVHQSRLRGPKEFSFKQGQYLKESWRALHAILFVFISAPALTAHNFDYFTLSNPPFVYLPTD